MGGAVDYQAVANIFEAMRTETINGSTMAHIVGGAHPMPTAIHIASLLADYAGLRSDDHVVDVGCGVRSHRRPDPAHRAEWLL